MPITFKSNVAVFKEVCTIDETDALLQWLIDNPKGKINLKAADHLHTALLQVLMCHCPAISVMPENANLVTITSRYLAATVKD